MIPRELHRRIPSTVDRVLYIDFPAGTSVEQMSRVTLRQINAMVREAVRDPVVRAQAAAILSQAGVAPRDHAAATRAIHRWVQRHFRYEYDPKTIEMVTRPREAILAIHRQGRYAEDCDGFVVTEMALLGVVLGPHNVRSTVIKADRRAPGQWSHIYLQARVHGQWITLDPIMQGEHAKRPLKPIGWEAPKFYARERVPVGVGAGLAHTARRDGLQRFDRGPGMGKWIPAQHSKGNAMAYNDDTWFERLPNLPDHPQADAPTGVGAVMSHQYAQRALVKGGQAEQAAGIDGLGAVLSQQYAQQAGVPGYRPTTVGEDPQVAAGTPYWEAPGTVGGAMRSQADKTAALSGVSDYVQIGATEPQGGWESVLQTLLSSTGTVLQTEQVSALNRERIRAGLPPLDASQVGTNERHSAGAAIGAGTVAAVAIGGAILWALTRRTRR